VFNQQVRTHRRRSGLSQEELAHKAGLDPKTIRSIEAGRTTPRPSTVRKLADVFGLDGQLRERFCAAAAAVPAPSSWDGVLPVQLPPDVPGFTGRRRELTRLDDLLAHSGQTVLISAVSGTAGVGKTALAVHWAHRVAGRFPDGQLYVNLRGFDPDGRVMAAGAAVRTFLDALGVPAGRVPATLDAQVGLYRSLLAGRRVLVLLDNARDAAQVRPLLPGTPTALVLVTSRNQLTPLVAVDGAHVVDLGLFPSGEAREMLARRLGASRVAAEPAAVDAMVVACAGLPLALAVAAGRARQAGFPLAAIAAELRDAGRRLDALDAGDPSSEIRVVFSWSYGALSAPAARLFRFLGLHPGLDIAGAAAASLVGARWADTRPLLTELLRGNVLAEHVPGRYRLHDLLRVYAADLARHHDTEADRRAAVARLLAHYTHSTHAAERLLHPRRDPIRVPLRQPAVGVTVERFTDDGAAMSWLGVEHPVLLAALRLAVDSGHDLLAWQLAWTLDTFLIRRGHRHDLAATWRTALAAAHRLDDAGMRADALRGLAVADIELGRLADSDIHAQQATARYVDAGDLVGQARSHTVLAYLRWRQGDPSQALEHAERGLRLFRATGHEQGIANELNGVGWYHAELGRYTEALAFCEEALALLRQLGDRVGESYTWDSLGYAHHHLGHHAEAADCYLRALALHRELGDRHDQADTLTRLGDTYLTIGDTPAAREALREALGILVELDLPDAAKVRARIDAVG
jgi:DNA-binding XRE family transcriptional regulator